MVGPQINLDVTSKTMNKYSLNQLVTGNLLTQFREEALEFCPYREAGLYRLGGKTLVKVSAKHDDACYFAEKPAHFSCEIETGDRSIILCIYTDKVHLETHLIEKSRTVLEQAIEMDLQAREVASDEDLEEELAKIEISEDLVGFLYISTTVNTSWYACFVEEDGKWEFETLGTA